MADVQILQQQVSAAPLAYTVPGGQEILVKVLSASFDGSGAGVSWQPAITLVGPGGVPVGTFPLTAALAAGASADVSWFPRSGGGVDGGGAGIRFDTYPQDGGFLYTHTDATGGAHNVGTDFDSASGIWLTDDSNEGILLKESGGGGLNFQDTGGGGFNASTNGGVGITESGGNDILISENNGGDILIRNFAASQTISLQSQFIAGVGASHINVGPGSPEGINIAANVHNPTGTDGIGISCSTVSAGGNNPGQIVSLSPNIGLTQYKTEPAAPTGTSPSPNALVYLYDDTVHVHLKIVFQNGTRATIATD